MAELRDILSDRFLQHTDFQTALTHRSAGKDNNERLEYIGDAVLDMVISEVLYREYAERSESELTQMRSSLVCNETLAEVARAYQVPELLVLGKGTIKNGGRQNPKICANALEAIIGALYLAEGWDSVKTFVYQLYQDKLQDIPFADELKDSKSKLQEYIQSQMYGLPEYRLVAEPSAEGETVFRVECVIPELSIEVTGEGTSKNKAQQDAAGKALDLIEHNDR